MSMRMMRLFLPGCLLLIGASTAFAQADPRVTTGGSGSCQKFVETSLTETFTHVQTGCVVDFTDLIADNDGVSLDILVVNINTPFSGNSAVVSVLELPSIPLSRLLLRHAPSRMRRS
jgi:hypothetical protein